MDKTLCEIIGHDWKLQGSGQTVKRYMCTRCKALMMDWPDKGPIPVYDKKGTT